MPWFDWWNGWWWFLFPMAMCAVMMLFMAGSHGMRGHHMTHYWRGDERDDDEGRHGDPALETLRQRFASGELTAEEYEERKRTLAT